MTTQTTQNCEILSRSNHFPMYKAYQTRKQRPGNLLEILGDIVEGDDSLLEHSSMSVWFWTSAAIANQLVLDKSKSQIEVAADQTPEEMVFTANLRDWRYILKTRLSEDATPLFQELMVLLLRRITDSNDLDTLTILTFDHPLRTGNILNKYKEDLEFVSAHVTVHIGNIRKVIAGYSIRPSLTTR